jgi:phosphoserine aminotransferase
MAMWSMLGARPCTMLAWESFGAGWVTDVVKQLKLDATVKTAEYGEIVDLATVDFDTDVVFTWNGTTSGVRVPNGDAIPADRAGLTICDATSRGLRAGPALGQARCHHLLLAEGAGRRGGAWHADPEPPRRGAAGKLHARLAAAEDLPPDQGRQADRGHLQGRDDQHAVDAGVEDYLLALDWAQSIGGLPALMARADANARRSSTSDASATGSTISPPIRRRGPTPRSA